MKKSDNHKPGKASSKIEKKVEKKAEKIKAKIAQLDGIIEEALKYEKVYKKSLKKVHPDNLTSAKNLIHYRSLRLHDLSELQKQLGNMGLSRLAKIQGNVLAGLHMTKRILRAFLGKKPKSKRTGLSFKKSKQLVKKNAKNLLGYRSKGRFTRIMVTLPSEAAHNYGLVEKMIAGGMNCARINCAHDDETSWLKMIGNIRKASKKLNKRCVVAMDLGGPKIRTGAIEPGPKVKKYRPRKDIRGKIIQPLLIQVDVEDNENNLLPFLPVSKEDFNQLDAGDQLYFRDARNKKRSIYILEKNEISCLASISKTCYFETGGKLFFQKTREGEFISVGQLPPVELPIILKTGDYLRIDRNPVTGAPAKYDEAGKCLSIAHVSCTAPEIFDEVKTGEPILFDDGKISGIISKIHKDHILVEINHTLEGGGKLRADKGINLPESKLTMSGLTQKDKRDLKFVVRHADVVNMSFVNSRQDVSQLISEMKKLKAKPELGVILKIETQQGFNQLTDIILEGLQLKSLGVMIARGDLAVEVGWINMGRVQQEIMSLCEAAHVTDIWATQVLENLAKRGVPSRAEITDVVKAQQADCVMLNKGPFILDSIKFLDLILKNMEPYREKSARLSPAMKEAAPK